MFRWGQTIPMSCLMHSLRAVPLINVRVGWRGKIPLTYEWTHWTLKLRRNSVNPPWGKTLNMLEGLHKLTAVLIQTWISSWKEIHVLWMSLHSACLLLSIVVSLRRERKTTSGIGVCQRNLKNVTVFSNVSWIYHLGGDSASGLYPSSVHKHPPPPSLPQLGWMITRCLRNELIHFSEAAYQSALFLLASTSVSRLGARKIIISGWHEEC